LNFLEFNNLNNAVGATILFTMSTVFGTNIILNFLL